MTLMKIAVPMLAALIACLANCSTTATLTPISGPLAKAGSQPIEIKGIAGNSGKLSFAMPSSEFVSGQWIALMAE
jgi:hypothetical protein